MLHVPVHFRFQLRDEQGNKVVPTHVVLLTEHSYQHHIPLVPDKDGTFSIPSKRKKGSVSQLLVIAPVEDQGFAKWVWPIFVDR